VWLGHFIEHLLCIAKENKTSTHLSHLLAGKKERGEKLAGEGYL